ncbi:MAG: bacterial transcriptional activator domain-containing protein [Chloroflexi bacterium]|nr:bacterial transcriptional activator domain-containing protein [Chloroflexota bacterium]
MLAQEITNVSFDSFLASSAGKKVVLLYPWSNYRNVFLSYFINGSSEGLLYYRIPESRGGTSTWVRGLLDEIRMVEPDFGGMLSSALQEGDAAEAGAALAEDMARLSGERVILYLDELDRVNQDAEFRQFITALVERFDDRSQLVVSSRLLTYEPWVQWVNRDEIAVMGAAHRSNNLLFTKDVTLKPQLEVYAFGRGHAVSNGREIRSWDGALPRNLFFYFMDNPLVTRDQIFAIFWPKLSIRDATNVFHVTKRKITERISVNVGDGENYELTNYSTGFYVPSDKVIRHYDVADFEQAIEGALLSTDARERQMLYSQAIDIYKAPFLYPLKLPWIEARRKQLQAMYGEALNGMARLKAEAQAWDEALGFYTRALREMPQREDIHRGAMQMYINLGRNADAREHYAVLERLLKRKLGVKPSRDTQALLAGLT